ncbi:nitrogenase molybdenum-iron protein alpha chain [Nitratidesulfovibrio vulgaris]|uniref:Nitrogenase protein alpha chain n=1 Tax=Nitratidesulfovibrio vulgaris (strain DP4) TaxID=391774 RepID=A0A0H3ACP9_NITV4|nr:nitrogenase molybdenum-iron protein alpha chain [Nitratidesulfovibrio vulgaris]ABM30104.1 nitrogenase molybdenum-iron protein alpha chain [Nitratidesulfovibrio vulgaris DP4]
MTTLKTDPGVDLESFVDEVTSLYPPKVAKKRRAHMVVRKDGDPGLAQQIEANTRTVPGIITQRGCCYAGCKGVVIGPYGDMVHIVHGPVGCSFYAWLTRRNQFRARGEAGKNYLSYCFTTDMQDEDIIFGGEKKLAQAIREAAAIFKPEAISVHATCPVGLIGDDIQAVARELSKETGIPVMAFNCEGYKGVSQSAGHHIANNKIFDMALGTREREAGRFSVNVLGEYNIGGDAYEIERVLEKCGIEVVATFSGNSVYEDMCTAHSANLNLVMCHRSINYLAEMMETKFGIPWMKVNFIGMRSMSQSLRKIARYFDDAALTARIESVIAEEEARAETALAAYMPGLEGKTAMLFVGGSRAHHYMHLMRDLGMEPLVAGFEFAHRDDYEGRRVIPTIRVDADSKNIEELKVTADPERYRPRLDPAYREQLEREGLLSSYEGMWDDMGEGTLVIDDVSHVEIEKLIHRMNPDIICSGIKDKYVIEKFGVPCKQLHNYDYSGPYAGYEGAVNFARDVYAMIHSPAWKLTRSPFDTGPTLTAGLND